MSGTNRGPGFKSEAARAAADRFKQSQLAASERGDKLTYLQNNLMCLADGAKDFKNAATALAHREQQDEDCCSYYTSSLVLFFKWVCCCSESDNKLETSSLINS